MGIVPVKKGFEHIHIEYEGGAVTLRFREYKQTLNLFKKEEQNGETRVVVSSSSWYEYETTIRHGDSAYFVCYLMVPCFRSRNQKEITITVMSVWW